MNELLLKWSRGQQAVLICSEQLGDKVNVLEGRDEDVAETDDLHIVLTCMSTSSFAVSAHILVPQVLQQLEFSVGSFRQDRGTDWLHDLLDGHGLVGELILCRATQCQR